MRPPSTTAISTGGAGSAGAACAAGAAGFACVSCPPPAQRPTSARAVAPAAGARPVRERLATCLRGYRSIADASLESPPPRFKRRVGAPETPDAPHHGARHGSTNDRVARRAPRNTERLRYQRERRHVIAGP